MNTVSTAGNGESGGASDAETSPTYGKRLRYYVLGVLTLVYVFNFIDRQILVILQESIKVEMDLSDKQLGLLTGFWFALFYVSFGIPIARWADHANRRNIIALSLTIWSGMTAVCGAVQSYWQLALARIGVGIGEAGGSPPAHSIISDYFPFNERATALSIYSMGIYIGIMLGFLAGGWVNEFFGWRWAFLVVGLPGVLVAILVRLTVREPIRGHSDNLAGAAEPPPVSEALATFVKRRSMLYICFASGFTAFMGYGIGNFTPSFLYRSHGLTSGEIGTILALISGIGGGLGTFLGGYLSDKLGKSDVRWYLILPGIGLFLGTPIRLFGFLAEDISQALPALAVGLVLDTLYLAPSIAAIHGLAEPRMRALASSILFFVLNLIGLGFGPLFVGTISDALTPAMGAEGLRAAIVITTIMGFLAGGLYLLAGYRFGHDIAAKKQGDAV